MYAEDLGPQVTEAANRPLVDGMPHLAVAWIRGTATYFNIATVSVDDDGTVILELEE